jgi:hypothetical protein
MGRILSSESLDLYEGRIKVVRLDADRLGELDTILGAFLEQIGPEDEMFVNIADDILTVRIISVPG